MPEKRSVAAVITNYNMAASLGKLLPEILEQDYDGGIYVMDDASTDKSREVAHKFEKLDDRVKLIAGEKNLGPGGNRNRVLGLDLGNTVMHFVDTDLELDSADNPGTARTIFADKTIGCVGGLIRMLPGGRQWAFNYGPRYSVYSLIAGAKQIKLNRLLDSPVEAQEYRDRNVRWLKESPDLLADPEARDVYWVSEANMLMPYNVFADLKGFDKRLRYHEIQDLAIRLHTKNYHVRFDPSISVIHPPVDMAQSRNTRDRGAGFKVVQMHGLPLH
ncbi:MAG TPA: glycosyltransferase [Candidatus Saccharimonadales bacterium]|jgi:N-acetylglucosaminyl-diphospho-decaprenol L-rhamnosyltransferase